MNRIPSTCIILSHDGYRPVLFRHSGKRKNALIMRFLPSKEVREGQQTAGDAKPDKKPGTADAKERRDVCQQQPGEKFLKRLRQGGRQSRKLVRTLCD
jgi:hypothetical protein